MTYTYQMDGIGDMELKALLLIKNSHSIVIMMHSSIIYSSILRVFQGKKTSGF